MSKRGMVYYQDLFAGIIAETDEGYQFAYDREYLEKRDVKPISLTLPLSKKKYSGKVLFAFFDGLIPEGWLLNLAIDHWKVQGNDRFELLLLTCRDTIGAVTRYPRNCIRLWQIVCFVIKTPKKQPTMRNAQKDSLEQLFHQRWS